MKIYLIKPYAFCPGVQNTINKTMLIIKSNKQANIYLVGNLIHNDLVCKQIQQFKNVRILDDKNTSRLNLVKSIKTKNNILIFSAHGTDPKAIKLAKAKGFKIYDLACPYVAKILKQIQTKVKQGFYIAYYGLKNHPEAKAAKAYGKDKLFVYKNKNDLKPILNKKKVCVVCQTTMDNLAYQNTKVFFKGIKHLEFNDLICASSKIRQAKALLSRRFDLVFVLSDRSSHNGKSLYEVLKTKQKSVIFVDPNNFVIDKKILRNKKDCAIFTSSSVSLQQVNGFVKVLKKLK